MSDQIIVIDLGTRSTKAVCIDKDGTSLRLVSYTIQDRPDFGKALSREALGQHISAISETLNSKTRQVVLVLGAGESLSCHAEMPLTEISQMRKMVKHNPKLYFQEELPNYSFDCFVLHSGAEVPQGKAVRKARTLIVGVRNQLLKNLQLATGAAGLTLEQVTTAQIGAASCFLASPEGAQKQIVALVDIGFSNSTISILVNGEITLTRTVNVGADKMTSGLAEAMNITYSVAEGLKQIMPEKVNSQLKSLMAPLIHELSSSIHFFEQNEDKKVAEIYVSGGSARSAFILQILQTELGLPCKNWSPTSSLKLNFTAAQLTALQQEASQLAVAIGAGIAWFKTGHANIDLLAEQKEEAELRTRDPMRRAFAIAAVLVTLFVCWFAIVKYRAEKSLVEVARLTASLKEIEPTFLTADSNVKRFAEVTQTIDDLNHLSDSRFLLAPALNALQYTVVDNFQVIRLQIGQQLVQTREVPAVTNLNKVVIPKQPSRNIEQTTFTIQAKSSAKPSAAETFMKALDDSPWFKANLRSEEPIRLKESQAPQVDFADPKKITILFTVECYAEHNL